MVPFERALVSFYRPSIVSFPLSLRVSEILPLVYLGLGVSQVEKWNGYIHVFMCIQANDSSADFS